MPFPFFPRLPRGKGVGKLFVGLFAVMVANGLLLVLFGVRSTRAGFGPEVTSYVLAGYYLGFLGGSWSAPRLIRRFGGPHAFTMLCVLASVVAVSPPAFVRPWFWVLLRVVQGFAFAAMYVVVETWLNRSTENENRARLLGVYVVLVMLAFACGAFLYQFVGTSGSAPFLLAAILAFAGGLATLRVHTKNESEHSPTSISMSAVIRRSPIGAGSMFLTSMANASFLSSLAVYATLVKYSDAETSWLTFLGSAGPLVLQGPITRLSDKRSRHGVLFIVTLLAALFALGGAYGPVNTWLPFLGVFVLGGLTYTQYGLSVAETNDTLSSDVMASAGSRMVMLGGVGALTGSLVVGRLTRSFGAEALFLVVAGAHLGVALLMLVWRTLTQRRVIRPTSETLVATPD